MTGAAIPQRSTPMISIPAAATTTPSASSSSPSPSPSTSTTPSMINASFVNSFRVSSVADRLAKLVRTQRPDPWEFFNLCLALSRGIDYAVANNEIPAKTQELPKILKQVYQHRNELLLQAAIMVLLYSVKSACKSGWFLFKDADELITLANEIGMGFGTPGDITIEPSSPPPIISKILSRFYPQMKMGHIFTSTEVKPGFGAILVDFHIPKNKVPSLKEEKIRLFVAQTDNLEASSCLISPPRVNFLLNGKGVERRINLSMDNGPQCPTNVTAMLKYGTNLLQAVGHFNGNYIIAIAFMSETSSFNVPELQDYVLPFSTALDSDSEIVEGASRISLNCPISLRRIETPVKGHLCKHHQCFDYENFVRINSRRPYWRCPHCNQSVCCSDIRIDQHMVEILKEVGENVSDVIIAADGSWKAVMESDVHTDHQLQGSTLGEKQDGSNHCEPMSVSNSIDNVMDLTEEGTSENDAMDISETEDRKPSKDKVNGFSVATNLTVPMEVNNALDVPQLGDDFWSGILLACSSASYESAIPSTRMDTQVMGGINEPPPTNVMLSPVLTDAVSPAFRREPVDAYRTTQPANSLFPVSNDMQLHQLNSDAGRAFHFQVTRTPIAVQALPAQPQTPISHQRGHAGLISLMPSNAPSMTSVTDGFDVGGETERQQQFSRSSMNVNPASGTPSSSLYHHSMSQNWDHLDRQQFRRPAHQIVGLPAPSQVPGAYRASAVPSEQVVGLSAPNQVPRAYRASAVPSEQVVGLSAPNQVPGAYRVSPVLPSDRQHQPAPHLRMSPVTSLPTLARPSSHHPPTQVRQVGSQGVAGQAPGNIANSRARPVGHQSQAARPLPSVPVQLQAPRNGTGPSLLTSPRTPMGEQRGGNTGPSPFSRVHNSLESSSEQNWQPTGRMRGSLTGRDFPTALSQFIIQPTQQTQAAGPPPPTPDPISTPGGSGGSQQLPVLIANSFNAHRPSPVAHPSTGDATDPDPDPISTPRGSGGSQQLPVLIANSFNAHRPSPVAHPSTGDATDPDLFPSPVIVPEDNHNQGC